MGGQEKHAGAFQTPIVQRDFHSAPKAGSKRAVCVNEHSIARDGRSGIWGGDTSNGSL